MRLLNYIFESNDEGVIDLPKYGISISREDIAKIKKECSQIVRIYKRTNKFLYRGLQTTNNFSFGKIIPRTNRRPKDTPREYSEKADDFFYRKFGWQPRKEGVFAVARFDTARSYSISSHADIIFPANGFKYIWSPEVEDLYADVFEKIGYDEEENFFDDWIAEYGPESNEGEWHNHDTGDETDSLDDLENVTSWDEAPRYDYIDSPMKYVVYFEDEDGKEWEETWEWQPRMSLKEYMQEHGTTHYFETYINKDLYRCLYTHTSYEVMIKCKYYYTISTSGTITPEELEL